MTAAFREVERIAQARVKCLLVDDLEENLMALEALLGGSDVEILKARSGPEALEHLLLHDFALALLDVQMPGMDGFELAELMRGSERTRHVPIIFLTAGTRDERRLFRGYESGAVDFIYKPIEASILRNKVEVFFQLQRQKYQLAQQLEERTETLRLYEMFTAVLGHDLRNPLSTIIFCSELIQHAAPDPTILKRAGHILSSGQRMSRMIDDLLDLARARLGGGIPLRCEPVALDEVVERVAQEQRASAQSPLIEVSVQGDAQGVWDAERLAQVASNLIGNAVEHRQDSGPVRVVIDGTAAHEVALSVSNSGTIPAADLPHLFDAFHSGQGQPSSGSGLGLGLYIVRQIAHAHGGAVAAQSSASGQTTFTLRIPRDSTK